MQNKDESNVDVIEEVRSSCSSVYSQPYSHYPQKLKLADQIATLLRRNVVQGVSQEEGTFRTFIFRTNSNHSRLILP